MALIDFIRTIPDHPKPGIQFRDITTLLQSAEGFGMAMDQLGEGYKASKPDLVAGIDARGFIFGAALSRDLGVGFVPIRKKGKLPGAVIRRSFELEYGTDEIEIHADSIPAGAKVLLVDDLIATGGTAEAAVELIREAGGVVDVCAFVIALPDLGGIEKIEKLGCRAEWLCEFKGD